MGQYKPYLVCVRSAEGWRVVGRYATFTGAQRVATRYMQRADILEAEALWRP